MTLYYTMVFVLLITEMVTFFVLVTPLPFNLRRRLFAFISESKIIEKTSYTLKIVFAFILILFIDSVNRVYRVHSDVSSSSDVSKLLSQGSDRSEIQARKFYSQRNMYLCGFTLFLSLILNRTYVLVVEVFSAQDKIALLSRDNTDSATSAAEVESKNEEIAQLRAELSRKTNDLDILKKQAEGLTKEYHSLGDKVNSSTDAGSKKDN
ncbi:B-cell receptor-associated protein 31-like-domain-containing protein [Kockiozyma suomiensis]|uniref:B-cell receptor-associated protein 31-like-domain-containing protein n=1 Tax=Kockiozyma suomiensis TaxID=1337062 RepID=UPI003343ED37